MAKSIQINHFITDYELDMVTNELMPVILLDAAPLGETRLHSQLLIYENS